uniref:DDE Tnp4 domain-containing protein n=1 Tax=Glossina brevipalpis TaxID=37001 RepID=A0A1A9X3N7_9MUSC
MRRFLLFSLMKKDAQEVVNMRLVRRSLRDESNPLALPENEFIQKFRVSKAAFQYILEKIEISGGMRSTYIPPVVRLALSLQLLGSGSYQWVTGCGYCMNVAQSTVSTIVSEVVQELQRSLCAEWIQFRINSDAKMWFYEKYGIPGVFGCVSGTHIYLSRPKENADIFINRKGKHSVNGMIICDHEMKFMTVNFKFPGSSYDSYVWQHSAERAFLEDQWDISNNSWILGGSGYPLEPWLMTPYRSPTDSIEKHYNDVHSKARSIVERCIGVYKNRWRVLMDERKTRYDPDKLAKFANVCAALHNICIHYRVEDEYSNPPTPEPCEDDGVDVCMETPRLRQIGEEVRQHLASTILA